MKNYKKILAYIVSLIIILTPIALFSAGRVPDCADNTAVDGVYSCDFNYFMTLLNNLINYVLYTLATPIFALIIIYVGWLYLSAGGNSENVGKAKKILKNAVIGYVIALAAWLIVKTILTSLGFESGTTFLSF
ncbi:TPA: hypothetical protein DIC38_02140 [Candidatus Nomurabacteria bacterium]|nr:MAG: hypothetical protein O210_OD1C00001G0302 [Parcubacteria bacterium RAAC4_OD1_1]HCY26457.1 hypothetical protein [Candidatus Nomurabacteria bacterium]